MIIVIDRYSMKMTTIVILAWIHLTSKSKQKSEENRRDDEQRCEKRILLRMIISSLENSELTFMKVLNNNDFVDK